MSLDESIGTRKWSLLGIPDHQGVLVVGGRIGAAGGPQAFRRSLLRMKSEFPVLEHLSDCGDVGPLSTDVETNLKMAAIRVEEAQRDVAFSVIVGGGHDHGFSQLQGIQNYLRARRSREFNIGCINIDAHLDLRGMTNWHGKAVPSSGSPFYLAIERGVLRADRLVEFGIQKHANGPELWTYAREKGIQVIPYESVRRGQATTYFQEALWRMASKCEAIVISLDLDAAAEAFAPGVSAPQAEGFTSSELIEMVEVAGRDPKVISLGVFELNPEVDRSDQTARLASTLGYHFALSKLASKN